MKYFTQISLFLATLASIHNVYATQIMCSGRVVDCRLSDPNDGCLCPSDNQTSEKALDGTYDVELTIGDKVFHDILEMRGQKGPINIRRFGTDELAGTMNVPGAFSVPITGTVSFHFGWPGLTAGFNFSIVADENGQKYKVYYEGMIGGNMNDTLDDFLAGRSPAIINGRALVDGENGQKKQMGLFKAVRRE